MQPFRCGCLVTPQQSDDYCDAHRFATCHVEALSLPAANRRDGECPPCFRARMLSVDTTPASQLLSHARRPGIPPTVRLAEPGEIESPVDLMEHSRVRRV